jgi:signal transduction histidine kinase
MQKALIPLDEDIRIAELDIYDILDTADEKEYDQLTELIKQITRCTYVGISFIDRSRQWFKSRVGFSFTEIPRDMSLCAKTILQREIVVVNDLEGVEELINTPGATGGLKVRFYASTPIVSNRGQNLGTVCVFDPLPHSLDSEQLRSLEIISLQVTRLLELRVKNRLIIKKSAELLDIERKTIQYTLTEQEKERQAIGVELHENLAQTVATCMMYLSFAADGKNDLTFLQKTKTELNNMLGEMRRLSKSFNPLRLPYIDLKSIVKESVEQATRETELKIKFSWKGKAENVSPNTAANLFRIITQYLRLLDGKKDVSSVYLKLVVDKTIEMEVTDDGRHYRSGELQHTAEFNTIATRIHLCQGIYDLKNMKGQGNMFIARLPLYDSRQLV